MVIMVAVAMGACMARPSPPIDATAIPFSFPARTPLPLLSTPTPAVPSPTPKLVRVDVANTSSLTAVFWINTEAGWADTRTVPRQERATILAAIGDWADIDAYAEDCRPLAHVRWSPEADAITVTLTNSSGEFDMTVAGDVAGPIVPRPEDESAACSG